MSIDYETINGREMIRVPSTEGIVSISLSDSWTGKKILESIGPNNSALRGTTDELNHMRYQQKQKQELEQKRNELLGSRGLAPLDSPTENGKIQIGNGKVRQMFVERRQRVIGIDKSYPLLPITTRSMPNAVSRPIKVTTTSTVKRSVVNSNHNDYSNYTVKQSPGSIDGRNYRLKSNLYNETDALKRSGLSSKLTDNDFIENEQFPDYLSQLDDDDLSLNSGRQGSNSANHNHLANLMNNNNSSANSITLRPVIMKKSMADDGSANSLNNRRKLPTHPPSKVRSTPLTPEKVTFDSKMSHSATAAPTKKMQSMSLNSTSSRSSASSIVDTNPTKESPRKKPSTPPENCTACRICDRFFNNDRLQKHEIICEKTATKKRKIFDATKHRVKGTEAEVYVRKAVRAGTLKKQPEIKKKADWRRKHEEFIQTIRSAKKMQEHLAKGGKLSDLPPPPPSDTSDYTICPHCQRKFNEGAAERHIPKCANYQFNKPKPNASNRKRY